MKKATLGALADTELPKQWPDRELNEVSGISLLTLLEGKSIDQRPPIHLLFGSDRGLRDGDWKLVSFRSQPWELYNMASDRTELNNLADKHPEIVNRMSKLWHEMAENVLEAPARSRVPVATEATPHQHPEWTDFNKRLSGIGKREG